MKRINFILLFILFIVFSYCKKDNTITQDLVIDGFITDSLGNPINNICVEFNEGYWGANGNVDFIPKAKAISNDYGYYSVTIPKKELNPDNGLRVEFENVRSIDSYHFRAEGEFIDLEKLSTERITINKVIKSGGFITIVKKDNPSIEYTDYFNPTIVTEINQLGSEYYSSRKQDENDTIINNLLVRTDTSIIINWRIQRFCQCPVYYSTSDTINAIGYGENLVYEINY